MAMKISIITATFNAGATLADCLESVGSQAGDIEHIIIDGGSSDNTPDIVAKHRSRIVRFVSEPDKGIFDAMNKGVRMATGDIVGTLNADDVYAGQDVLGRVEKAFEDASVEACYGDLLYVYQDNLTKIFRHWRSGNYNFRSFYWGWMPPHPTFFVRRGVYGRYGLYNLDLGTAADYELMLRFLLKHRVKAAYIPEILVRMRSGGVSNSSVSTRLRANEMDYKAWTVNGLKPYPFTLILKPLRKIGQFVIKRRYPFPADLDAALSGHRAVK
jgi:glycosyltransferase